MLPFGFSFRISVCKSAQDETRGGTRDSQFLQSTVQTCRIPSDTGKLPRNLAPSAADEFTFRRAAAPRRAAPPHRAAAMTEPPSSKVTEQEYEMTRRLRHNMCGMKPETTPNYAVKKAVGQGATASSGRNVETSKPVAIKKIPKAFEDIIDCSGCCARSRSSSTSSTTTCSVDILALPNANAKEWKDVYIVSELMDTDLHYIILKQPLTDEHSRASCTRSSAASTRSTWRTSSTATSSRATSSSTRTATSRSATSASRGRSTPRPRRRTSASPSTS